MQTVIQSTYNTILRLKAQRVSDICNLQKLQRIVQCQGAGACHCLCSVVQSQSFFCGQFNRRNSRTLHSLCTGKKFSFVISHTKAQHRQNHMG